MRSKSDVETLKQTFISWSHSSSSGLHLVIFKIHSFLQKRNRKIEICFLCVLTFRFMPSLYHDCSREWSLWSGWLKCVCMRLRLCSIPIIIREGRKKETLDFDARFESSDLNSDFEFAFSRSDWLQTDKTHSLLSFFSWWWSSSQSHSSQTIKAKGVCNAM